MTAEPPQAPLRTGPRPLPLHLLQEAAIWLSSPLAWALSSAGSPLWSPSRAGQAASLVQALAANGAAEALAAVEAAGRARLGRMLTGIERYRRHPYRRDLPDPPALWRDGAARLLDFRDPGRPPDAGRPTLLLVPSLINRAYILDLAADRSFARAAAGAGLRPLLLDWGRPGEPERGFTLTDYIAGPLERALETAADLGGGRTVPLGYCMGGLLALAAALRRPSLVAGLVLLATPWDFARDDPTLIRRLAAAWPTLSLAVDQLGALPTDALQAMFAGLDPRLVARKFMAVGGRAPPPEATMTAFVALEDWLNDGVPLAGPVAREAIAGWHLAGSTVTGAWRVAGRPVDPRAVAAPTLAVIPRADRIVPPGSALALATAIPQAEIWRPALGHIGMMAAARAQAALWAPLFAWIARR